MPKNISSERLKALISPQSDKIRAGVDRIAALDTVVLFCGETGTGKDFWAQYLAEKSGQQKFVNLNCGDVTPSLLESEWFGYRKGAFTGADQDYAGRWASAADGTLFINQIDLLEAGLQSRLLRIIERKKYYPVGALEEESVDARLIFSASEKIEQMVEEGSFRSDLYYRISVYKVDIPPLRERQDEILTLLNVFASEAGLDVAISKKSCELLKNYPWPGNIRELENFVSSCGVMKSVVEDRDVSDFVASARGFHRTMYRSELSLKELNYEYAQYMVEKYRNKSLAAEKMGVSRKTLYNILNRK